MTDETPGGGEAPGPEVSASDDPDARAWEDGLLARARVRSTGETTGTEHPTGHVAEDPLPAEAPEPEEPTWRSPAVGVPIVTRADLTGGGNPVAGPLEGTFDLPVTPPWSGAPTTPPTLDAPVDVRQEVDLGIPGRLGSARRSVIEWGSVLVGALVLALIVRTFLFQAFYIPSPSMEPTLWSGDRILVNKLSYQLHDVNRGDLVVFRSPPGAGAGGEDLIKRVIALPGERVTSDGGRLLIGGGLRRVEGRKHIFVCAALKGDRLHADFIHQPVKVYGLHDDADGAGDGEFVCDDEPARSGDVITAGRRHPAHRSDDGFAGVGLELDDGIVDFIGGEHFAAGGIDAQHHGFDAFIGGGEVELFLDARHHILLRTEAVAGDDAGDRHDGDAMRGVATAHDGFGVKIGWRGQRIYRLSDGRHEPTTHQQ